MIKTIAIITGAVVIGKASYLLLKEDKGGGDDMVNVLYWI